MDSEARINFGGRFEYLEALRTHWAEVLESLASVVLPKWRESRLAAEPRTTYPSWEEINAQPEYGSGVAALRQWAKAFNVADQWVLDAAVQTLASLAAGATPGHWHYHAPDLRVPEFRCQLQAAWLPEFQSWDEFKANVLKKATDQLEPYRRAVALLWGGARRTQPRQAVWTALFQRGKSPGEILLQHKRAGFPQVTQANIHHGIRSFAKAIGLTLRTSKYGPRPRI